MAGSKTMAEIAILCHGIGKSDKATGTAPEAQSAPFDSKGLRISLGPLGKPRPRPAEDDNEAGKFYF